MLPSGSIFFKKCLIKKIFEGLSDPIRNYTYNITSVPSTDTGFCVFLGSLKGTCYCLPYDRRLLCLLSFLWLSGGIY